MKVHNEIKRDILLLKIEFLRKELISLGKEKGFNSPETLLLSQNLDEVILKYQKLMH